MHIITEKHCRNLLLEQVGFHVSKMQLQIKEILNLESGIHV